MPTVETLYIQLYDLTKQVDRLETKLASVADFVQSKFPGELSPEFVGDHGELGTDPELKPIPIVFGEPEERINGDTQ